MIRLKWLKLSLILIVLMIPSIAIFSYFHILIPNRNISISDNKSHIYSIDNNCLLLVWENDVFFVYPKDYWVGKPSDYRNILLGLMFWPKSSSIVFWPRGSYVSIPLGDGVKDDPRNQFEFEGDNIFIKHFFKNDENPHEINIKL